MKTALITGISGQDGAYLSKLLLEKNYRVIGGDRRTASGSLWRLKELGIVDDVEVVDFELGEFTNIFRAIEDTRPDEVYNLAAQSFVGASFEMPTYTSNITGLGVARVLEAIKQIDPSIKFYQASTSELFGKIHETPQLESTPFYPRSPYGVAKLFGHWITINYREAYDMFACSGILFNHESPLRGEEFVTRKIIKGLVKIKKGLKKQLLLGNVEAKRDWGFAGDYVEAMYLMMQHDIPDDYVISTGENHSIKDFIKIVCDELDIKIEWSGENLNEKCIDSSTGKVIIKINTKYYRPAEVDVLLGDSSKAKNTFGWKPKTSFEDLVSMMIKADYHNEILV